MNLNAQSVATIIYHFNNSKIPASIMDNDFLSGMQTYQKMSKRLLISHIETSYKLEHLRHFGVADVIQTEDEFLIEWFKRPEPLSDEELNRRYR